MHDLVCVVGPTLRDTYDELRRMWFGEPDGLHIDGYIQANFVDGYQVMVEPRTNSHDNQDNQNNNLKLFAINLGAYQPGSLVERHDIGLYVAFEKMEAVKKAKDILLPNLQTLHKDNMIDIDDCLELDEILKDYTIRLTPVGTHPQPEIVNCYTILNSGKY